MKQILRRPVILFGLILLPFLFNNCSQVRFGDLLSIAGSTPQASESSASASDTGNGTGYGGKLTQTYYHYVPGYVCENRPSPFSSLEHTPSEKNSVLTTSKENQCLSIPQTIPNTQIDAGSLQNKVVGFEDRIFEVNPAGALIVPESPIEIWCVDQWNAPTVEILSLYNKAKNQASTEFYYPGQPKKSEINPARTVSQQSVRLTSSYFDLVVDKAKFGLKAGTFQGQLTINGRSADQKLQCRLGSYLDARLWPAQAVNYNTLQQVEWNPLEGVFYAITDDSGLTPWAESNLSTFSAEGQRIQVLLGDSQQAGGARNFTWTADRSKLLVQAHLSGDAAIQLYLVDPKQFSPPKMLNARLTEYGQAVGEPVVADPAGDLVYYLDGSQEVGGDIEQWLYAASISTGKITQINKNLTGADQSVGQFEVSSSLSKVVYSAGFTEHQIWVTGPLGQAPRQINLSTYLGTGHYLEWYIKQARRWLFMRDRYLILTAASRKPLEGKSFLLVLDLESEKVIFSKLISGELNLFPLNDLPIVTVYSTKEPIAYLDLNTNTLISSEQLITTLKGSSSPQAQQMARQLEVTAAKNLCGTATVSTEPAEERVALDSHRWLVLKKGTDAKTSFSIYSSASGLCQLINQMVLPTGQRDSLTQSSLYLYGGQVLRAKISPDQRNILATIKGRLYLIPVDGNPVIEIYTPLNSLPHFSEIGFVSNSKVYFVGSVIKDFVNQLFLWNVPQY